ncbi:MAG TPA: ABC transporter ATP-binding protein [Phycisphaerae bacterium]|mgnify:CR=1 FL=1|jgi:putative ABC transport system ATP-binding protein|nr:ABC transporter ATP-binding protein [Phycisphaerae bacterium]HOB75484.1 ABC transporter ATP-binding protein [Phycisphaerae bacterium]HOJ55292.1 ABC transporter ATP-binding protein [Phycisphaerae bacterium]HOL27420.1 ABC transporter ATP-binding protein [Phycisphaerae bacterium]HPP21595.1 ABC transporter ATP-binding protein [Phycisphaerae bacterium]
MNADIELRDVYKVYRKGRIEIPVLEGLNLQITEGEFVAMMGPSGSGKSTLLHLMGGLDVPTAGSVRIGDARLETMNEQELTAWRSRHVGFIFQLYHLVPVLTAAENVELPLLLFHMSASERKERVATALEVVGLADRMDHRPNQLSGGQEQRVAIARAIVTDPDVILADEPTGDLDAKTSLEILNLLNLLNTEFGKTILMVTHDPKAAAHAKRVLHLNKGVLERDEMNGLFEATEASI